MSMNNTQSFILRRINMNLFNKKYFILCIFLFFIASLNIYGQANTNVSFTNDLSSRPTIAVNQHGVILVVWTEGGDDHGFPWYNVYRNGAWEGTKGSKLSSRKCWAPQLSVDSTGLFHLAYADGNSSTSREIYHAVYDPDTGWKNKRMIWNSPANSAWQKIDIKAESEDRIYIAWYHQNVDPFTGADIVMQSKKVGSQYEWPNAYERITYTANVASIHNALSVRDGRVHMAWMEGGAGWSLQYAEAQRGANWKNVNKSGIASGAYYPEMEVDEDGNVHLVWSSKTGNIFYKRKEKTGWKVTQVVGSRSPGNQFVDIKHKANTTIVMYRQKIDNSLYVFYVRNPGDAKGDGNWEKPVQITTTGHAKHPKCWIDDEGYAHFIWADRSKIAEMDIFYNKYKVYEPAGKAEMKLNKKKLSYTTMKDENPDSQDFIISNVGERFMDYTVTTNQTWLSITPTTGNINGLEEITVQVDVDVTGLAPGKYSAIITVDSERAENAPKQITVNLEVLIPPTLEVNQTSFSFSAEEELTPASTTFTIKNTGDRLLNYTNTVSKRWMMVSPASGLLNPNEKDEIQVQLDARDDEGEYKGVIQISSTEAINSPQQISVTLDVSAPPIYAPLNFVGVVNQNKTLLNREYIHKLTWSANPDNKYIEKYMLYEISGVNKILLQEYEASATLEYVRRHIDKTKTYTYEVTAVDKKDREGTVPAQVVLK